jgi:hypothetical protein
MGKGRVGFCDIAVKAFLILRKIQPRFTETADADAADADVLRGVSAETLAVQFRVLRADAGNIFGGQHAGIKVEFFQIRQASENVRGTVFQNDAVQIDPPERFPFAFSILPLHRFV